MEKQLGFDALLMDAEATNKAQKFAKETDHLPNKMNEAIAFYKDLIELHHNAMLVCDFEAAHTIRREAHLLAKKLNGGQGGIIAGDHAPGCVLSRETAAPKEQIPLWGQDGTFIIQYKSIAIEIEMKGIFGIGATSMTYLGFSAKAVDQTVPFISETGYRSFLGVSINNERGMTTKRFAERVISHYIDDELKGRLLHIADHYPIQALND